MLHLKLTGAHQSMACAHQPKGSDSFRRSQVIVSLAQLKQLGADLEASTGFQQSTYKQILAKERSLQKTALQRFDARSYTGSAYTLTQVGGGALSTYVMVWMSCSFVQCFFGIISLRASDALMSPIAIMQTATPISYIFSLSAGLPRFLLY